MPLATSTEATKAGFSPSVVRTATNSVCGGGLHAVEDDDADERGGGGADQRRGDAPADDRAAEHDDVAAIFGLAHRQVRLRGIEAGDNAVEEAGRRLRRRARVGKRLQPLLPGRDRAPERRIGGETRLGRPALLAVERAEHVLARQGLELVSFSLGHQGIPSR